MSAQRFLRLQLERFGHIPDVKLDEDQESIVQWAHSVGITGQSGPTFGKMAEEFQELAQAFMQDEQPKISELGQEIADVYIMLVQFAHSLGLDLYELTNAKMKVNRNRKWRFKDDGTAQHLEGE